MKHVVIAPYGENVDALFVGIREFPTERVILITPEDKVVEAEKTVRELQRFQIPAQIKKIKGNLYEGMFEAVAEIKNLEKNKELLINVTTGNPETRCAATSAAFVNGIKAFAAENGDAMLLPVLKFSYYKLLTEKKMEILRALRDEDCCSSFEELSKRTKMSLPLISYHVNGNLKSDGLKELGLVDTAEEKGRIRITLSSLGRLLIKGYVD